MEKTGIQNRLAGTKGVHAAGVRRRRFLSRETGLLLVILAVSVLLSLFTPKFLNGNNLVSVGIGMTYDLIVALGMTLVLIVGGIDLSVGSVLGLTGILTTLMLKANVGVPLAVAGGLGISLLAGAINGLGVTRYRIPPFIATLGMMAIARGTAIVLTSGYFVSGLPEGYKIIGQGKLLEIPFPVYVAASLVFLLAYLLKNWGPMAKLFYVGSNPAAAELSGINVRKLTFFTYVICSLLAGTAAIFMTSRLGMGYAQFGLGAELRAIAASVIGGASLAGGGVGSALGTFLGVALLAVISNGFVLLNASVYWQGVVNGGILVVAVAVDAIRMARQHRE